VRAVRAFVTTGFCLGLLALLAGSASAAPVLVFDGEHGYARNHRHVPSADLAPPGRTAAARPRAHSAGMRGPSVYDELARLLAEGQIDQAQHDARVVTYKRARRAYRALTGTRRVEMRGALRNVEAVAASRELTPSRLEPLFLTLQRNMEYWSAGPLIANGRRVTFTGSRLVWQYYRGQGLAIQPLANWGKANSLANARRRSRLRRLLGELVPLVSYRGGSPTWEYYFAFGRGAPPWTSAMSQGTAIQALGRAAALLEDASYRELAASALGLFEQAPPVGVRLDTASGAHYLLYSFAPDLRVLNGFLQSVIGLHDFAQASADPRAQALFTAGDAEARADVPRYDTGAWSLYSLERESDLAYHRLVRTFLGRLCERTGAAVYCETSQRFTGYLDVAPEIAPRTRRIRAGRVSELEFRLSKISRVGLSVTAPDGSTVFDTSATVGFGERSFRWSKPATAGGYTIRLTATDLAGNRSEAEGPLRILPRRR
jgi:D-glucuronyl C5-epimerase C-terminus